MAANEQPYDRSFFAGQSGRSLAAARIVLAPVFQWLRPRRLADIGCGVGTWLRAGLELGATDIMGVDGAYVDRAELLIDASRFVAADLASETLSDVLGPDQRGFDLAICMEVAEHLPHARGGSLIAELAALSDAVVFSAAVPFQYGTSHVNEQWPDYWAILFRAQGFACFDCLRAALWADPDVDWWYAQNALIFAREGSAAAAALPKAARVEGRGLAMVHPENLLANLLGLPRLYRQDAAAEEVQDLKAVLAANRHGDAIPPALLAPARAATASAEARNVFPYTRTEIFHPEQQIADLAQKLGETGQWLQAANTAVAAEREARIAAEGEVGALRQERAMAQAAAHAAATQHEADIAVCTQALEAARAAARLGAERDAQVIAARNTELLAEREARSIAEARARQAEQAAHGAGETKAREAEILHERVRAQAATRYRAEARLAEIERQDAARQQEHAEQRQEIAAEMARFTAERQAELGQAEAERAELQNQAQALARRADALARLNSELEDIGADLARTRASIVWRVTARVHRLTHRLPTGLRRPVIGFIHAVSAPRLAIAAPEPEEAPCEPAAEPAPLAQTAAVETTPPPDTQAETDAAETSPEPDHPLIKRYGEVIGEVRWWTLAAAVSRLRRLEVFDAEDYLRRNGDVAAAGVDPYEHFIQSGALEGRGRVNPEDLARLMSGFMLFENAVRALPPAEIDVSALPALVADVGHVGIYVSSHGNIFMEDLAEDLAADLRRVGVQVDLLDENAVIEERPPLCLFVAPHEFFILGRGPRWVRDDVLSNSFLFGTEQVQTMWFNLALPFMLMARGVLDICVQTAELFERTNTAALHLLPGARHRPQSLSERDRQHPLFGVLPEAARGDFDPSKSFIERPIDIAFFGTSSPRRDQFFARNAAFFAEYEMFNYCRRKDRGPLRGGSEDGALTRLAAHVSGHSKITLNIHRDEFGYFEWHRMVRLGMCSGSLVVSDPCLPHPDFIANEHYLQERSRHIPDLLEWLITTPDGNREAERVRANANQLITKVLETRRTMTRLLGFLAKHRRREQG